MEKLLSVIIPTLNRVKLLKKCLASLEQQTLSHSNFEVIVISDGSTDETHNYLESFSNSTEIDFRFYIQKNSGASVARNLGVKKSRAELIVFIDDDCVATPDLLKDYLDAIPEDPLCAGIGGEIENIDHRKHKAFFNVIRSNRHPDPGSHGHVPYLITANALYRKRCLTDVGGFDLRFHGAGGEDPDLSQRINERGYYLKTISKAKVYHHDRITLRGVYKTRRYYGKGNRLRAEIKNLPLEQKNRRVKNFEFKQMRGKYIHLKEFGFFTKLYWTFLQIAFHRGYNKGYQLPVKAADKNDFVTVPKENPMPPTISVIIPCYNDGEFLPEAVESVEQFPDGRVFEIIVIDDGSDEENTAKVLEDIEGKGHLVIRPGKVGKCQARNLGIKEAKGKYILTLDADNKIEWDYMRKSIYFLDNHPEIGVIYGNHYLFGDEENYKRVMGFDIRLMLAKNYIDTCAVFRKSAWESVDGFDENMPVEHREDWNFWLDLFRKGWGFHSIDEPMFHYRVRENAEGKKGDLPENKNRIHKYICEKYDDMYRNVILEMYRELEMIQNSRAIKFREFLKFPVEYIRMVFPKKEE